MGQDRPSATLTDARSSPTRSDDPAHASRAASADYASPAAEQPAVGDLATVPAMVGLALGAGPGMLLRASSAEADPLGGNPIPDGVLSALRRRRGGGQPLTSGVASQIGEQLGPAASAARIHTDGEADHLARSVQSVAFSYGSDVYFTQGSYAPDTQAGQRLLAHELSHVRQGATGSGGGGPIVGRADDAAERDADHSADQVLGALRRQAARRATPACDHAGPAQDSDVHAAHAGHGGLPALVRRATEVVRRVYTEQEQPSILQLAQVGNSQERLNALGAHNWSRDDTVALAQRDPAPSYAEMNTLMARLTAAETTAIRAMCADWAEALTVAALPWPAADLARHAGVLPRPSVVQLQTVSAFFGVAQVDGLMPICTGGWADLVTLAGGGWTAADIAAVAALGAAPPTSAQLQRAVDRLTAAHVRDIVGGGASWTDTAALADAAVPAVQAPALTLSATVAAFDAMVARDVAALGVLGFEVEPQRYKALLIGTEDLSGTNFRQVMDYLSDARFFSICFDTAQRLFDDLGNVPANASGGARGTKYALALQQTRSALLVNHLNGASAAGQPVIFNVHVGGHGFSLTVIAGQVYQMEAFASQAGGDIDELEDLDMSLLTSIGANRSYALAAVTGAITDMTSANPDHRERGANAMGWNPGPCGFLDGDGDVVDPMAIWWESASLHSNADIVANVATRILTQRNEIARMFGI